MHSSSSLGLIQPWVSDLVESAGKLQGPVPSPVSSRPSIVTLPGGWGWPHLSLVSSSAKTGTYAPFCSGAAMLLPVPSQGHLHAQPTRGGSHPHCLPLTSTTTSFLEAEPNTLFRGPGSRAPGFAVASPA